MQRDGEGCVGHTVVLVSCGILVTPGRWCSHHAVAEAGEFKPELTCATGPVKHGGLTAVTGRLLHVQRGGTRVLQPGELSLELGDLAWKLGCV